MWYMARNAGYFKSVPLLPEGMRMRNSGMCTNCTCVTGLSGHVSAAAVAIIISSVGAVLSCALNFVS